MRGDENVAGAVIAAGGGVGMVRRYTADDETRTHWTWHEDVEKALHGKEMRYEVTDDYVVVVWDALMFSATPRV